MTYRLWKRKWATGKRVFWTTMAVQLCALLPLLVLFGLAQPDLYRTKMWEIGHANKFNSDPRMILYAYANFQPLPTVPLVWSQLLTNYNVAITIVTLFILLVVMIGRIMKIYYPLLAVLINAALIAVWTVSVYGQMGPDYADPRYPSPIAWYISKSCDYAIPFRAYKSCQMAKGTFAATVIMLGVIVMNFGISLWSMRPNNLDRENIDDADDSDDSPTTPKGGPSHKAWEMTGMTPPAATFSPGSPRQVPYTPRTMAFHTLDRKLPLRSQYA